MAIYVEICNLPGLCQINVVFFLKKKSLLWLIFQRIIEVERRLTADYVGMNAT